MAEKVSDFLLKRLSAWGVKRIFGYPGDGILGIMSALQRHPDLFQFVQVRHEEMAAFMASAHAKYTGEPGVCLATSGPGAIHLLNGLYDAKMDHQPVLAIVGQSARSALGGNYQQEVDLMNLFKVTWFEEPVSSDDMEGLHLIRDRGPSGMDIAAGEYGYDLWYFRRMLEAEAVDVLQADATRCAGSTGFMRVGALVESRSMQLSSHCGPSLHVHPCCALNNFRHMEYFHDHVRIEHMFFDGALDPINGVLRPDLSRPGMGLELKRTDAEKHVV